MTIPALSAPPALAAMSRRLTLPFARGADILDLELVDVPGHAVVKKYDFCEHEARFGLPPVATYILRARSAIAAGTEVEIVGKDSAGENVTDKVEVGSDVGAGDSFALQFPPHTSLKLLRETGPQAKDNGPPSRRWQLTALLGTTARLLWVIGAERDRLARLAREVRDQRVVAHTSGAGLDLLGADLAVPRFPPTPYSVDDKTVALYHLDDAPGSEVADAAALLSKHPPHHGTPKGHVLLGAAGRYDRSVRFTGPGTVIVDSHPDFDVAADGELTVDLFVQPDPTSTLGTVAFRGVPLLWALDVGDLGLGGRNSVRARLFGPTEDLTVSADVDLPTDRFSHVAAVLTRHGAKAESRLSIYVDGVERAWKTGKFGALIGDAPVVLGPAKTGFRGALDEVRISSVARTDFHPVLGESDKSYRARLTLFRRWELPTPANLQAVLNRLVPELNQIKDPFIVDDTIGAVRRGVVVMRVWPNTVAPLQSLDRDGRVDVQEGDLWPTDDGPADPNLLGRCTDPRVEFAAVAPGLNQEAGLPEPDPCLMTPNTAAALTRLVDLFAQEQAGKVTVTAGYDASEPDGRARGRALHLAAETVGPGRLAALAHRAGFDFVMHHANGVVYAATAPGCEMMLGTEGSGQVLQAGGTPELVVGDTVALHPCLGTSQFTPPQLPADTEVRFWLIGAADRATLEQPSPGDTVARLTANSPGLLALSVDVTRGGRTTTATTTLRVVPRPLEDGQSIASDGTMGVMPGAVRQTDPTFKPEFLTAIADHPQLELGANRRRTQMKMNPALAGHLKTLLDDLRSHRGKLAVTAAYSPESGDIAGEGRRLVLTHSDLDAGVLAAAAHRAGFAYVSRHGAEVFVADAPGDLVGIAGPLQIEVGQRAVLTVSPEPAAVSAETRLGWSSAQVVPTTLDRQGVQLTSTTETSVEVLGIAPGCAWVEATLREAGGAGPYTFEVRLRPELDKKAHISREQYYLLMNALNTFHPLGVEVRTERIRSAVPELSPSLEELDPSFSYPAFRRHRAARSLRTEKMHV